MASRSLWHVSDSGVLFCDELMVGYNRELDSLPRYNSWLESLEIVARISRFLLSCISQISAPLGRCLINISHLFSSSQAHGDSLDGLYRRVAYLESVCHELWKDVYPDIPSPFADRND